MKSISPLLACALLLLAPGWLRAQEEPPPPPGIELDADHPLAQRLAEEFPKTFGKNPTRVLLTIKPADPQRQKPAIVRRAASKYPAMPVLDFDGYRGDPGKTDDNVLSATRQGDNSLPKLKIVILAPGHGSTTVRSQPSLWWYQSQQSRLAEVTFLLTEISGRRPKELLRVPLKAMPKGYNSFNLANPALNPDNIVLRPGVDYQWTISVRNLEAGAAVFNKIRRVNNPALEKLAAEAPAESATLKALSKAGNWYELFDSVSRLARYFPDNQGALQTRSKLLEQAGILSKIAE